ncbi:MAG: DUF488 domain-containing protein [Prevotellaceae bacterium]|jgi:uncharacterized protein (DUF488 family)|nr:DUF488 domain-containing protein [Prevotellaceae bacterium]
MLYYRRKILLALLEVFDNKLTAKSFQKYLFLFTRKQETKTFDFVPYKYGCFSFSANQDIATLKTYGYVEITDLENGRFIQLKKKENYCAALDLFDRQYLSDIKMDFGNLSQEELIKYTYIRYPFYAINSSIAEHLLTSEEYAKIKQQRHEFSDPVLFTIGYEDISLEAYINKLIINDVKILCDVRKNAFSHKYGFSKSQLNMACQGVGIKYVHLPALGIESELRQDLRSQKDYDILFERYEKTTLKGNDSLNIIIELLKTDKRVALTCFEKNPSQCHRSRIAKELMAVENKNYTLKNL